MPQVWARQTSGVHDLSFARARVGVKLPQLCGCLRSSHSGRRLATFTKNGVQKCACKDSAWRLFVCPHWSYVPMLYRCGVVLRWRHSLRDVIDVKSRTGAGHQVGTR